jgi:hypothetical protein
MHSTTTNVKTLEVRFVEAVKLEDLHAVKELIELADINRDVVRGSLKYLRKNVVLAAYLIGKGADVKLPNLLKDVILTCTPQLMAFFIEEGCLLIMSKDKGCTHLIDVLFTQYDSHLTEKLELLLRHNAPFSIRYGNCFDNTPFAIALQGNLNRNQKESMLAFKLMYHYKHSVLCDVGLLVLQRVNEIETDKQRTIVGFWDPQRAERLRYYADIMLLHPKGVTYQYGAQQVLHFIGYKSIYCQKTCNNVRLAAEKIAAEKARQSEEKLAEERRIADFESKIAQSRVASEEVARQAAARKKLEKDTAEKARQAQNALREKLQQEQQQQEELRVRIAEEIRLKLDYERKDKIAQIAQEREERRRVVDIECRRQQEVTERLRLAEIEEAQRLAAERDRVAQRLAAERDRVAQRLAAECDRVAAEQEAERQRILAEEAKQKTDLVLQITMGTDESLKVALDLIRGKTPLNITDNKNRTPLHLAAMMGHRAIVRALLMKQIDRELRDIHDNRAEDLAKDDATRQVFLEVPSNQKIYTREFQTAHNIRDAAREAQDPRAKAYLDKAYHREQKTAGRRVFSQVNTRVAHDSYDLHAMETEPAKDMVKKLIADQRRLANRSGCTRVVTLILGRGNHSTDGNPSINPAIRGMLMKRNIDFHDQGMNDGAIEVRFTPLTTDDTSSVTDSISTSN